jgi:hypothetical protein
MIDLRRRRDQLNARVAELTFDLGGLVYEMAVRDQIRVDVLVQRAAVLRTARARRSAGNAVRGCSSRCSRVRSSRPDRARRPGR